MPTLIYNTGFEHGVISVSGGDSAGAWFDGLGGTPTCDSTVKRTGTYSLKLGAAAATQYIYQYGLSGTYLVGRAYFYRSSTAPAAERYFLYYETNAYHQFRFGIDSNGKVVARVEYGTIVVGPTITAETWYRLDFRCYCGATTGTIDWQINGAAQTQATGTITASTWSYFAFGDSDDAYGANVNIWVDDFALSGTTGDYPIGAGKGVGLSPNGAGTSSPAPAEKIYDNGGVLVNDASNPANVELDDVPLSVNTDYIKQTSNDTDDYVEVTFADISDAQSVNGARAILAYMSATATANNGQTRIIDEDTTSTTVFSGDMSEASMFYKGKQLPTPAGAWDQTAVNALKGRVGYSSDTNPNPYWENLMIEVDYVEAAAAVAWIPKVIFIQ